MIPIYGIYYATQYINERLFQIEIDEFIFISVVTLLGGGS